MARVWRNHELAGEQGKAALRRGRTASAEAAVSVHALEASERLEARRAHLCEPRRRKVVHVHVEGVVIRILRGARTGRASPPA
eukprot:2675532-Pleurochrysis_carterae.AAC.1